MLRIHELLQKGAPVSRSTLAAELEVSPKTVGRDLDFMRDRLGLPLEYDPARHGFVYTRRVVQFPTMTISEGELVALSVARKALTQYRGTPFEQPLRAAFEKLTGGLRDQIQFAWGDLGESISFRTAGQGVGDLATFETASQGVLRAEELAFSYQKLGSDAAETRRVEPLHLACIDHQWYLFARDRAREGAVRTFALTRIAGLRATGRRFERPADFSLDDHLADSFGVFSAPEPREVRLRFDAFSARLIRERTWHASQSLEPLPDGRLELTMHLGLSPEVERWILGWGAHVEALAPAALREKIGRTARQVAEAHGG